MTSLATVLDNMTIKQFRTFEKELAKISEQKVTKHFRRLFSSYVLPGELSQTIKQYLDYCHFDDSTILSRALECEDNLYAYSIRYDEITFHKHDAIMESWTLKGTPDEYTTELPYKYDRDWSTRRSEHSKVPLPEDWLLIVRGLWLCYRIYIDSNPDDDRSLDEEEEEHIEEMDALRAKWAAETPRDWEAEREKRAEEYRKQREKEEASRAIEQQVRKEKRELQLAEWAKNLEHATETSTNTVETVKNAMIRLSTRVKELVTENQKLKAMGHPQQSLDDYKKQMQDLIIANAAGNITPEEYHSQIVYIKSQLEQAEQAEEPQPDVLRLNIDEDEHIAHAADYQKEMDALCMELKNLQTEHDAKEITHAEYYARRETIQYHMVEIYEAYKAEINH